MSSELDTVHENNIQHLLMHIQNLACTSVGKITFDYVLFSGDSHFVKCEYIVFKKGWFGFKTAVTMELLIIRSVGILGDHVYYLKVYTDEGWGKTYNFYLTDEYKGIVEDIFARVEQHYRNLQKEKEHKDTLKKQTSLNLLLKGE